MNADLSSDTGTIAANLGPFPCLTELRNRHSELVKEIGPDVLASGKTKPVTDFIFQAAATGAILDAPEDRAIAQGLINFWVSRLSSAVRSARGTDRVKNLNVPQFDDTVLAPFDPKALTSAIAHADDWFATRPQEQKLVRRLMLRLCRLTADGQTFEPVPASRGVLRDFGPPAKVDEIIETLQACGVVRVTRRPFTDGDVVELRSPLLLSNWARYREWQETRRKFRKEVEAWTQSDRPEVSLLRGEDLLEALTYHDLNVLEREFTEASQTTTTRRWVEEADARRTRDELRLVERAAQFHEEYAKAHQNPNNPTRWDKSILLDRKQTNLAESWMDKVQSHGFDLLTQEIRDLITRSRDHWIRDDNRRLRVTSYLGWSVAALAVLLFVFAGASALLYRQRENIAEEARTNAEKGLDEEREVAELTKRLKETHDLRNDILKAIPVVETNPAYYVGLSRGNRHAKGTHPPS